ncbi:MAG: hypothetical protein RJB11_555 [Planctomycetota bacterium]
MQFLGTFNRKVVFRINVFTHALRQTRQFKFFLACKRSLNVAVDKFKSPLIEFCGSFWSSR